MVRPPEAVRGVGKPYRGRPPPGRAAAVAKFRVSQLRKHPGGGSFPGVHRGRLQEQMAFSFSANALESLPAMYRIIGADQKEYGPVTTDQIKQWIAQGRVNGQTNVQAEGSGEWKPLREFPEFAAELALLTGPAPAGIAGAPAPLAAPSKTSGMAITSLVLGILGAFSCGILALPGLILGIISLVRINKSQGKMGGQGIALAGTIVSAVFVVLMPLMAAMTLPALAQAKSRAMNASCMNNAKQLCLAVMLYNGDNNDHLPPAATWCDAISSAVGSPKVFKCPAAADQNQRSHFAFNSRLNGLSVSKILSPATTVLLFETDGGWNLSGGPERLKPHHSGNAIVGFVDGHVELVTPSRFSQLQWDPGSRNGGPRN
jgi:prepilin-type processing-associated H-X9-DG protein